MPNRRFAVGLAAAAVVATVGCSAHHHRLVEIRHVAGALPAEPIRVAVLPFLAADPDQPVKEIQAALRAAFETALLDIPNYRIVERAQLGILLTDEVTFDKDLGAKLEEKQVDAYVAGELRSVSDHAGHAELHTGVKLIDRRSGDVLWSASADIAQFTSPEQLARQFARDVVAHLLAAGPNP